MNTTITAALLVVLAASSIAHAELIQATLTGYEEVPPVSTVAKGEFRANINPGDTSIDYQLTHSGLQGTVTQAHIHIAQPGVNGSIVIWLCQTAAARGPTGTQTCPQSGTIIGVITSANVIGTDIASQQITAGELDEVVAAIRAGVAYVNIHTSPLSTGGEIRGQIHVSSGDVRTFGPSGIR